MAFSISNRKNKETGNNSSVSEIEPTEIIEPVATVPPEITHEEISNNLDESATNEIAQNNVDTAAETAPPPQLPSPPNTESPILENEIESGPEQSATEIATETPPAPISQRKNRRRGKKPYFQEDNSIDEEFASRLDMSCANDIVAPNIENAYIADYIRYDLFKKITRKKDGNPYFTTNAILKN